MCKAAQASLTNVLASENDSVVRVALVMVARPVSPEEKVTNPDNIEGMFWELHQQERGS